MSTAILWPTFALVALIFAVWFVMYVQRIGHMRRTPPTAEDFATGAAALRYFQPVEMSANNFRNLFEMPVLYFALVPLLMVMGQGGGVQAGLAWSYVLLRGLHSVIHVRRGSVMRRFMVYLASCVVLAAMWVGFAVDMVRATL